MYSLNCKHPLDGCRKEEHEASKKPVVMNIVGSFKGITSFCIIVDLAMDFTLGAPLQVPYKFSYTKQSSLITMAAIYIFILLLDLTTFSDNYDNDNN